jgi:excisionase family DNA binding protein
MIANMHPDELLADAPPKLTLDAVAAILGRHRRTINNWVREGFLPAWKLGGQWVVDREEFREWLRARHN